MCLRLFYTFQYIVAANFKSAFFKDVGCCDLWHNGFQINSLFSDFFPLCKSQNIIRSLLHKHRIGKGSYCLIAQYHLVEEACLRTEEGSSSQRSPGNETNYLPSTNCLSYIFDIRSLPKSTCDDPNTMCFEDLSLKIKETRERKQNFLERL